MNRGDQSRLAVRWLALRRATAYVRDHHRHLPRVRGGVFALGCYDGPRLCGVAILGRPIARLADTGERLDVTRCATDGTPNAASALYGAARRVAQALGLLPPHTHTRLDESGASLRGAGWVEVGRTEAQTWNHGERKGTRSDNDGAQQRILWRAPA